MDDTVCDDDITLVVQEKLWSMRSILRRKGYLQKRSDKKRGTYWELRIAVRGEDDRRHHLSVYVGNDAQRRRVQYWLDLIRGKVPGTPQFEARQVRRRLRIIEPLLFGSIDRAFRLTLRLRAQANRGPGRPPRRPRLW